VYDNARVSDNAQVSGNARVSGNAQVSGNAWVSGKTILVSGWAFATKHPDWKITELAMGDYVTLVKDCKLGEPEQPECDKIVTIDGKDYRLVEVKP
jgi:hypothetical protein